MANDLDLKDAIEVLAAILRRTEEVRNAVERSAKAQGISAAFLVNGAEREMEALNVAIASLLLARGRVEEAADTFFGPMGAKIPDAPIPAPAAPPSPPSAIWPKGAEIEPPPNGYTGTLPRLRPLQRDVGFRPVKPEISF